MNEPDPASESQPETKEESTGFFVGLCFLLISGYFFVSGFFIARPEGWQTAPGLLPIFLGGMLFLMSVYITWDTVKRGAIRNLFGEKSKRKRAKSENSLRSVVIALCCAAVFYFFLLEFLPFEIAAFLFLVTMMQFFWQGSTFVKRLTVSLIVPFLITGSFQGIFSIPLPGDGNIVQFIMYWVKG